MFFIWRDFVEIAGVVNKNNAVKVIDFVLENLGQKPGSVTDKFAAVSIIGLNTHLFVPNGCSVAMANAQTTFGKFRLPSRTGCLRLCS